MLYLNHSTLLATEFVILCRHHLYFGTPWIITLANYGSDRRPRYWIRVHGCTVSSTRAVRLYSHVNARQLSPITERVNEANSWSPVMLAPRLYLFHNPCMSHLNLKQIKRNDIYERMPICHTKYVRLNILSQTWTEQTPWKTYS